MNTLPKLNESLQFYKLLTEYTNELITIISLDGTYLYVSPAVTNLLGYLPDELLGKSAFSYFNPEDLEKLQDQKNKNTKIYRVSHRLKRKDGGYNWFDTINRVVTDERLGPTPVIIAISREISDRKTSEEMVKRFVQAVEYASDFIIMANADGTIMYANPALEQITGFSPPEVIGKKVGILWEGDTEARTIVDMWDTLLNLKKSYIGEVTFKKKNGDKIVTESHITPILENKNKIAFFVGISRDITKAKEVDRMKTEFISIASHQLRTPLASMKWHMEMLLNGDTGSLNKDQERYIGNINKSNERMIELVNALLNISRIESGRLLVDPQPTNIIKSISDVIEEVKVKLKEKNITLDFTQKDDVPMVLLDQKLVHQVYLNLIGNAIKYSPVKSSISVTVSYDSFNLITKVVDHGYGIPLNEQEKIFSKFFRGSNITKIETEGTGLGLYLVKSVVEALNGKIWFTSEENKGSTFNVTFSLAGAHYKPGEISIT